MAMTPEEKEKRMRRMQGHLYNLSKEITKNISFLMDSDMIPIKTLVDTCERQQKLYGTLAQLNELGQQVFQKEWSAPPPGKILDMNGHNHNLATE